MTKYLAGNLNISKQIWNNQSPKNWMQNELGTEERESMSTYDFSQFSSFFGLYEVCKNQFLDFFI